MGHADPGTFHLTLSGFTAQVRGDLIDIGDTGSTERMALGEQAARDVNRHPAAKSDFAVVSLAAAKWPMWL